MDYKLSTEEIDNKIIYVVTDENGDWVGSFANERDALDFIEMLKARDDDALASSLKP